MSILNSLSLLEMGQAGDFRPEELVAIARRNADRLHHALNDILDVASLESGVFHVKLRELDLERLVDARVSARKLLLRDRGIQVDVIRPAVKGEAVQQPVLADPQKLGRAIDLCLHILASRTREASVLQVRVDTRSVEFIFELDATKRALWEQAWSEAQAGIQAGVRSPGSAFRGTLASEQEFLTREEEGLGSEFLLAHEIIRLHRGEFRVFQDTHTHLCIELPALEDEEGLRAVLASRAHAASHELSSVALGLIWIPTGEDVATFRRRVQKSLFRSTDAVYPLAEHGAVALVLDDCKPEDAPGLIGRIQRSLGYSEGGSLEYGLSSCPSDGADPDHLITAALRRLRERSGR